MARATDAQLRQRELAWLIYQLRGARGNLCGKWRRHIPSNIDKRLRRLGIELEEIEKLCQHCLQLDATNRSFRRRAQAQWPTSLHTKDTSR